MKHLILFALALVLICETGCTQSSTKPNTKAKESNKLVGGRCEGCEAIHESPIAFNKLQSTITLPGYNEPGQKIEVSGIVYENDGRTPAKDVVIYVYHTDQTGNYSTKGNEKGWGKRHGYIRGWLKTDKNGFYKFHTLRPASYPNSKAPQHIHVTVKEPELNEYWIDEYLFADDPNVRNEMPANHKPRGGSGVIELVPQKNGVMHGTRHIILGQNVPDYPATRLDKTLQSGLPIGSNCPAFDPLHLSGADKGKKACPMCKYGYGQGVMVWFNHANVEHMKDFILALEKEMIKRGEKKFRVFLVYMNPFYKQNDNDEGGEKGRKLREWCEKQNLQKVAMTWIPSPVDGETAGLYQINPEVKNTVMLYKKRVVKAKWVNMDYTGESLKTIMDELDSKS